MCGLQWRGCCRDDGDVPLKTSLRPHRIAHSGSHVPCSICRALCSGQAGGGDGGDNRESRDFAFVSFVSNIGKLCSRTWCWSYLEQSLSDPHFSCCEHSEQVPAHTWQLPAKQGSSTGLRPSDLFQLLHPPGRASHTKILPWMKPEHGADEEMSLQVVSAQQLEVSCQHVQVSHS